ncbi:MAG: hypothetical protein P8P30_03540 [Rickettsiales bacterium]|nr:hypothetical protein [Rickettsiales bacterium]
MPKGTEFNGEAIIEFIHQGRYVKVTAIDPVTGIEASIVGDPKAPEQTLQELAIKRLAYVIKKRSNT